MNEEIKKINLTAEQIDNLVGKIDNKIAILNMKETMAVSELLGYNLPIDYCTFYSKQLTLHIKPNLFKVNNVEKIIRYLFSMDKDNKNYIMKFQYLDSQYNEKIVPFAELEFGDLLCFNKEDDTIVYYDHEQDKIATLAKNWTDFRATLYEEDFNE